MCRRQLSEALCQKANAAGRVFLQYTRLSEGRGKKTGTAFAVPVCKLSGKIRCQRVWRSAVGAQLGDDNVFVQFHIFHALQHKALPL